MEMPQLISERRRIAVFLFLTMQLIVAVAFWLGYRLGLMQAGESAQPWMIIGPSVVSLMVALLFTARYLARLVANLGHHPAPFVSEQTKNAEECQRALYLRATLENLPFLFWLKDTQSRFLAVNKRFSDACGKPSPDSVVGLTDMDVWPPELAARYRADDLLVMGSGQEKMVEEPVAGGTEAGWIETFKKPVLAENGTILGTVGFARDISERIFMQRALQESEERWALAVKGANDGIWDWNPEKGTVFFSNRWKSMLGYAADELGHAFDEWHSRIHPDDLVGVDAALARHLDGEEAFYQCEYRLRCKGGSFTWVSDRGQAQFDLAGRPLRMAGSLTDISARREAEARIHDRNQQLNAIFDLSPDGFVSFDAECKVKYTSPSFLRMAGVEEGQLAGLDEAGFDNWLAKLCVEPATFPGLAALRLLAMEPDKDDKRQVIELAEPGKLILEIRLRLAHSETVSQILYLHDITHESEVDRLKSEFLSTAAHELRTPMASIYGFTELLLNTDLEVEDRQDFLETIYQQSELMIAIVNELLDLSRIEARRGKDFKVERINLCQLLDDVVASFMPPDHREKPIWSSCLPDDVTWVRGDRNKLRQALGNVLSNAYKYSPEGGPVKIELIRTATGESSPAGIGICVTDHGIGMNAMQKARVCERFYRADTSGKIPGTGLGMSIVKEIIDLHHGELKLESQPRRGTVVTLCLPLPSEGVPVL
jgi:PAS domain S-box-containing protein